VAGEERARVQTASRIRWETIFDGCGSLACIGGISGSCGPDNPGGAGVRVTCAPPPPSANLIEYNVDNVGGWGGTCTCPDGITYQVGDNFDGCGSLACIGGISGSCGPDNPGGAGVRVTCALPSPPPPASPPPFSRCSTPPCAASLLGDVALTTATGTDPGTGDFFATGENVFGPFENGFGAPQAPILGGLGCSPASDGYVEGGIDTQTAEQMVAHQCGVTLPRTEGGAYISLMDECGGHTNEYHFHERMACLYAAGGTHSTQVAMGLDGTPLYGKWEDDTAGLLPALDACGAHFGPTPDSAGASVYHHHVQDMAPFTFGCYGPSSTGGLVSLPECRALYADCGNWDTRTLTTPDGSVEYDPWCPCFDYEGSNVGPSQPQTSATTIDVCVTGGTTPATCTDFGSTASVRCCTTDGSSCQSNVPGCTNAATYAEAESICAAFGRRLCTPDEATLCCGTGCGHDNRMVWTSESCAAN